MPSKRKKNFLSYSSLSIALRKRKVSSPAQPKPSEADQQLAEKVHYTTGGGAVILRQNAAYEGVMYEYEEKEVYEIPT